MASAVRAGCMQGAGLFQLRGSAAAFLVLGAQALLALTDSFAPLVAAEMSVWQFHVIRAGMMLPVILLAVWVLGQWNRLLPAAPGAVFVRTLLNVTALGSYFAVLPQVPLAQAAAGLFTAPVWVVLFLALRDRTAPDRHSLSAAVIGFSGAILALGGDGGMTFNPAALVPFGSGAIYALSVLATNRRCAYEAPSSLLFWNVLGFALLGVLGMVAVAFLSPDAESVGAYPHLLAGPQPVAGAMIAVIAALGCLSILAVGLLTRGYQTGNPKYVALFDYSYLIWAAVFSTLIWSTPPEPLAVAGLALILVSGISALQRTARMEPQTA